MTWARILSLLMVAAGCGTLEATPGGTDAAPPAPPRADATPRADAAPVAEPCAGLAGPSGSCYFLSAPDLAGITSYASATLDCAEQGAHLAVVTTLEENALLVAAYCPEGTCEPLWLGLNDRGTEGTWVWVDGSPFAYDAWGENEPNDNGPDGEDCVELTTQPVGGAPAPVWNDVDCVTPRRALCELT